MKVSYFFQLQIILQFTTCQELTTKNYYIIILLSILAYNYRSLRYFAFIHFKTSSRAQDNFHSFGSFPRSLSEQTPEVAQSAEIRRLFKDTKRLLFKPHFALLLALSHLFDSSPNLLSRWLAKSCKST